MSRNATDIYHEALQLSEAERAHLADLLEASVDELDIGRAWMDEARRRLEDIDSGRTQLIPGEEVLARLHSGGKTRE